MWQRYHYDYVKLYVRVVREVVMQEDPGRPFVMSSPSNGDVTKPSGWISRNPQSLYYGDGESSNHLRSHTFTFNWILPFQLDILSRNGKGKNDNRKNAQS